MALIDDLLGELILTKGSDLHVQSGMTPKIRVEGRIMNLDRLPLTNAEVENIRHTVGMSDIVSGRFIDNLSTDFRLDHKIHGRFRVNISRCDGGLKITARNLNKEIRDLSTLGFSDEVFKDIIPKKNGLVIITGTTNSGKTTTIASLLTEITKLKRNIITLEDPIEYQLKSNISQITQREYKTSFKSFPQGISDSLRMDPDVIMIGEMRDQETIKAALLAAETGHLVISTLHTTDIASTRNRIILPFESKERNEIATILDEALTLIVAQRLVTDDETEKLKLEYEYKRFKD